MKGSAVQKFIKILIYSVALAGCATTGEVTKVVKDTYMVGTSDLMGMTSRTGTTQASVIRANLYCKNLGKEMMLSRTSSTGVVGLTSTESEIFFKCLDASGPEYRAVEMQNDPSLVIKVQK